MSASLRRVIEQQGGLLDRAGIAQRWGVSRQRAHQLVNDPTFPPPVGGLDVWLASDVDQWRADNYGRRQVKTRKRGRTRA